MSKFPKDFGRNVGVDEVDPETADVRFRGGKADRGPRRAGCCRRPVPYTGSGASEKSPSLTIRLPKQDRARLEDLAAKQGRRASEVVREALDDYPTRHAT